MIDKLIQQHPLITAILFVVIMTGVGQMEKQQNCRVMAACTWLTGVIGVAAMTAHVESLGGFRWIAVPVVLAVGVYLISLGLRSKS